MLPCFGVRQPVRFIVHYASPCIYKKYAAVFDSNGCFSTGTSTSGRQSVCGAEHVARSFSHLAKLLHKAPVKFAQQGLSKLGISCGVLCIQTWFHSSLTLSNNRQHGTLAICVKHVEPKAGS